MKERISELIGKLIGVGLMIWVIVEFLIYLFKDKDFNWWSLGIALFVFTGGITVSIVDENKKS